MLATTSRIGAVLLVAAIASTAAAEPRLYVLDPARSQIRFHAVSRFMDADGSFKQLAGELRLEGDRPETVVGRVVVQVASIDTGNRMRDNHLRSEYFFDAGRYPEAVFVASGARRDAGRVVVTGELTIRGVTRPLAVPVTVTAGAGSIRVQGQLTVNRREFGVAYQSRLNPVNDEVSVTVDLTAVAR
jgi:polyisoprenoid-binding protein YceI